MKNVILMLVVFVLAAATVASATINVPAGMTGLWRFEDPADNMSATIGQDMVNSFGTEHGASYLGPWTTIGTENLNELYGDNRIVQVGEWQYLTAFHGISANGGGSYVNEYTIMFDYKQDSRIGNWNSLMQTSEDRFAGDGDLFIADNGTIGVGDTGYSTKTVDSSTWHRYVLSVDNGSFFKVYVDGELYLDAAGQAIDGRFALGDSVHLFGDDWWESAWAMVGTVAAWDNALTDAQVAAMGGWDGTNGNMATPLVIPEPATLSLIALGGFGLLRRKRQ